MATKPMPCPSCGRFPMSEVEQDFSGRERYALVCFHEGCFLGGYETEWYPTRQDAIDEWNAITKEQ